MPYLPGIIREVCEDLKIPGGIYRVGVFIRGVEVTERDGLRRMSPIFLFVMARVVSTVDPKPWEKRFWRGRRIVLFGGFVFLLMKTEVRGITFRN